MRADRGWATLGALRFPCALGRSGRRAIKREGDGATPVGAFAVRHGFYRPDRLLRPATRVPLTPLGPSDGWCDAVGDRNYNRRVKHPYPASAERMWREDHLYDVVIVLDHNERPRVQGGGSAVFIHVARRGYAPTAGCIAFERNHLLRLLKLLRRGTAVRIAPWARRLGPAPARQSGGF
ncbi:MAG: L,D-transpeptidase family protein [Hyphomicrobiaceae bacterium]|nr:L,D-transpeptidase family protein [Hyphomicrobiaceae bacterium]